MEAAVLDNVCQQVVVEFLLRLSPERFRDFVVQSRIQDSYEVAEEDRLENLVALTYSEQSIARSNRSLSNLAADDDVIAQIPISTASSCIVEHAASVCAMETPQEPPADSRNGSVANSSRLSSPEIPRETHSSFNNCNLASSVSSSNGLANDALVLDSGMFRRPEVPPSRSRDFFATCDALADRSEHDVKGGSVTTASSINDQTSDLSVVDVKPEKIDFTRQKSVYACDWPGCVAVRSSTTLLYRHKNVHRQKYQCARCSKCHECRYDLRLHLANCLRRSMKAFQCETCLRQFATSRDLSRHLAAGHGSKEQPQFACLLCGHSFASKWNLKEHQMHARCSDLKLEHGVGVRTLINASVIESCFCANCGSAFRCRDNLVRHFSRKRCETLKLQTVRTLSNARVVETCYCAICGSAFKCRDNLVRHFSGKRCEILRRHEHKLTPRSNVGFVITPTALRCSTCGVLFKKKRYLKDHLRSRKCKPKLEPRCGTCGYLFASARNLALHVALRSCGPWRCSDCGTVFKLERYLILHRKWEVCKKKEVKKKPRAVLRKGKLALACDWPGCDVVRYSNASLQRHKNVHTGTYACKVCGKAFEDTYHLKRHKAQGHR